MAIAKEYEVHLEMFEGPLDLLLFLIKKDDLDIYDIPISQITQEYLGYLDLMKDLSLEVAGEFLVLASTLMQIKARMLLPSQEVLEDEGPDPRAELVAKLLEYQKFKGAAKFLEDRALEYQDVFYRGSPHFAEEEKSLNIRIFDLLSTLREILDRAEDNGIEVIGEEFPIEEKMQKILFLLESKPYMTFRDAFKDERKRLGILACFMAVLELIKLQKIFARQDRHFGEILLYKREAPPPAAIWPGAEEQAAPAPAEAPVVAPQVSTVEPQAAVTAPQAAAVEPQVAVAEPQVAAAEEQVGAAEREAEVAKPQVGAAESQVETPEAPGAPEVK